MDGTITGEHGVGAAKLAYLQARLGADQMALLRRIKAAFDPAGILNPGKLGLMTARRGRGVTAASGTDAGSST